MKLLISLMILTLSVSCNSEQEKLPAKGEEEQSQNISKAKEGADRPSKPKPITSIKAPFNYFPIDKDFESGLAIINLGADEGGEYGNFLFEQLEDLVVFTSKERINVNLKRDDIRRVCEKLSEDTDELTCGYQIVLKDEKFKDGRFALSSLNKKSVDYTFLGDWEEIESTPSLYAPLLNKEFVQNGKKFKFEINEENKIEFLFELNGGGWFSITNPPFTLDACKVFKSREQYFLAKCDNGSFFWGQGGIFVFSIAKGVKSFNAAILETQFSWEFHAQGIFSIEKDKFLVSRLESRGGFFGAGYEVSLYKLKPEESVKVLPLIEPYNYFFQEAEKNWYELMSN